MNRAASDSARGGGGGGGGAVCAAGAVATVRAAALVALCLVAGSLAPTLPPASAQTSETPEYSVTARNSSITEGETAYFDFTRTGSTSSAVWILVEIEAVGVSLTNQTGPTKSVRFAAGRARASIGLATADNLDIGPNGSVTVTINSVFGSSTYIGAGAVVDVLDDELPEVTIEAQQTSITEGDDANFLVRRHGNDASPLTVAVSVTGGDSFLAGRPTEVTIPAGVASQQLTLSTTLDVNVNADETVTVTLTAAADAVYILGSPASASTAIQESSTLHSTVTIVGTESRGWVYEGKDVVFTLNRGSDRSSNFGVVVAVQVVTFSYESSRAYGGLSVKREIQNLQATFYENDLSTTLTVPSVDNKLNDGNRHVRATILPGPYAVAVDSRQASVWVRDDDLPTLTLTPVTEDHVESEDSFPQYTLHRSWDSDDADEYAEADVAQYDLIARVGRYAIRWFPDCPYVVGPVLYEGSRLNGSSCEFGMEDIEDGTEASLLPVDMPPQGDVFSYSSSTNFLPVQMPSGDSSHTYDMPPRHVLALGGFAYVALQPFKCDVVPGNCGYLPQYEIGTPDDAKVNLHNNAQGVRIESDHQWVLEGEDITFTVRRYGGVPINSRQALSVSVAVSQDGEFISGSTPETVSFAAVEEGGERDLSQTVTISTTDDSIDEADGTVTLTILDPPEALVGENVANYEPVGANGAAVGWYRTITVTVADNDDPAVEVDFKHAAYEVDEGGTVEVEVTLNKDPKRTVVVPLTATGQGGASSGEYSGVPESLEFSAGETEKSFTFTSIDDDDFEDGESVLLGFGASLPARVSAGSVAQSTVSITDDDAPPAVTVSFERESYSVNEGDSVEVAVTLSETPERSVYVELQPALRGGASGLDGFGVPAGVLFGSGEIRKTFTFTAHADTVSDDGESVLVNILEGTLPDRVTKGTIARTEITIVDVPAVTVKFGAASAAVDEGDSVTVEVTLSADPKRTVWVPITTTYQDGASPDDYRGVPGSLQFLSGQTSKSFTFTAIDDFVDDDDESVKLGFGSLPAGVNKGSPAESTISITDDDDPAVTVRFGAASYSADEGGTATVEVRLNVEPEREVVIPLTAAGQGGASGDDYSGVPASVSFGAGETIKSFTFTAAADDVDDDDESVLLGFGASLPAGVTKGSPAESTVSIGDDDYPAVTVNFAASAYEVDEGKSVTVVMTLSVNPERTVWVPVTIAYQGGASSADHTSVIPTNWPFLEGRTSREVTFRATADSFDDDDEFLLLSIGASLPEGMTAGSVNTTKISIVDDDDPAVTVGFGADSYSAAESDDASTAAVSEHEAVVTVSLSAPPERAVVVPITAAGQGGASGDDYSGVPASVSFGSGETSKSFTFAAVEDDVDDDGESVLLGFGSLPAGVSAGPVSETTVSIADDDTVGVDISETALTVTEGDAAGVSYTVELTSQPGGDVTVTVSGHSGTDVGLSGLTLTGNVLTFTTANWATAQTVTVTAADDDDAVTDPAVPLVHAVASTDDSDYDALADQTVTITITDDDTAGVDISETALTVTEGSSKSYTVELTSQPAGDVTVTVSGHSGTDVGLAGLDANSKLTFTTVNWATAQTVTVTAAEDDDAVTDPVVALVHAVASTDDSVYDALADQTVTVTITDDDTVGVDISETALTVTEGSSRSYTVELTSQPAGDVTVTVSGHSGTDVGLSGLDANSKLTFTTVNWDTAQTVTVTAAEDDDAVTDPAVTLVHAVASTDDAVYDALEDVSVTITITDDDAVGVDVSESALTVTEGSSKSYTVVLTSEPAGDVTVTVSGHSGTDVGLSGLDGNSKLTFTTVNWNVAQTVTVTAAEDDDAVTDPVVTLVHAVASTDDSDYDALEDVSVTVAIAEDDAVGVDISESALTVTEGSSKSYTVVLTSEPAGDVTVTVSGHSGTDVGLSGLDGNSKLTFTTVNWATAQTVTVTAAEDDDAVTDPVVTLVHAVASTDDSAYDALIDQTVTITIDEDDAVGVSINPTTLTVVEGSSKSYSVELTSQPAGDVTVTVSGHSGSDVSLAGLDGNSKLTFTTVNWATAQTVTVTAAEDADAVTDAAVALAHAIASADDSDYDALADQTVTITIDEDDAVGVSINPTTLTVVEGSSKSYNVELTSQPAGDVTVTVSGHSGTDVGLSGLDANSKLTFTTVNWNVAQTVTVTAAEDDDAVTDPAVTLVHAVASTDDSAYDALTDQTVTITITDNDAVGVDISESALTVAEGSSKSYTVELTSQPGGDVTVTVSGHSGTDVGLSGLTLTGNVLTFTTANWATAQTVTVTAAEDDDAVTDPAVPLVHAVASTDDSDYDALADQTVTITITDDDTAGVDISETALTVAEGDAAGVSYTVELTSEPAGDVTVTVSGHSGTDVGLAGLDADNVLTFTTVNWNVAQTVTVTAAEDDDAVTDAAVALAHAIASTDDSDYDALTDQTVTVTITDNDAVGVSINPTTLTVVEGSSKSYSVELTSQPAGDVTVTVSGHSGSDVGLSGLDGNSKLTFTTVNWDTAQTVTVTAAEDDDADTDAAVTLVHAVASTDDSAYNTLEDVSVTITITDNDAVGVDISETALTVTEGSSKSYNVELTSQPAGDVTVTVSGHSGTDVGLSGLDANSKLTFTTVNWDTAQTVTVTAAEDDDAVTDPAVTLVHAVASTDDSAYDALADQTVTITITDDDAVGVSINPTTLTVVEGSSKSYSVELTSQPAGDVTVTVSGHSGTDVGLSAAVFTDNVLTFTTVNWDTAQTVTVTAAEDDDAVTDAVVALVHAVASTDDSAYDALADQTVTITITDDDAVGVDISETALTVTEGDAAGVSYSVKLTSEPAGDVTVTVSGHSGTDVGLSGLDGNNKLTFTTVNWNVAQTVTVTAAEDDDAVTDAVVALVHAVASADDSAYDALADQTVTVTITDDDAVGVDISETALTVTEGDAAGASYTVVLTSEPAGDVTVTVSGHSGSDVSLSGLDGNSKLTFTTANWDTARTVTVTAAEDDDAVTDAAVALVHAIASTDDSDYDALTDQTVTVTITDDDAVGVDISETALTVTEGSSKSYTVELTSQPAGDVTVTVSGHSGTDVGLSGLDANNKLTFTTVTWNVAQTVTVTAAEDDDAVTDPAVTLAHAISSADDSDYDALSDQTVTVTITDDDAAGVDISQTALTVDEGDADGVSYTVELTSQPAGDVTVTVSGHSGTDVGLSGLDANNKLTFTTVTWNTAQTVTVTAAEDDDAVTDPAVTLVHAIASADDSDYDALEDVSVTVAIAEDDAVGVDISESALTVTEGSSKSYTVVLTSEPAGDVTVTVSGHSGTDVGLSGLDGNNKLTFTTVNWNVAQTVTVTAAEDDDAVTDAVVALVHAVASADDSAYDALADQTVTVTITDDDAVGVDISETALTVTEGDAAGASYTVVLTSEPAGDVTVTVSGHSGSDVSLSGLDGNSKLTFTTANWDTARTVTVTAAEDDDAVTDAAVALVHAIASTDDSDYDALTDQTVTVTITDDDAVGVDISETALTVTEGSSKSYTVELTSQPAGDVTVTVSGHSGTDVGLSAAVFTDNVLTFTAENWDTVQTVTVTAAEDDDADTDAAVTLAHAVASTDDSAYDALTDQTVTVTITDNDTVGVDISETALTVTEGSSKSYTVELTSQPGGDVTVTVSGHAGSGAALSGTSLSADDVLTFTTVNWSTAQTVTVTGTDDSTAEADETVTLAHAISSTDDSAYDALEDVSVTVTVQDNDSVGVSINPTTLTVVEGSSKSYTVELTSQPAGDVTVTVSGHSGTDVGLSAALFTSNVLTFTTVNWATAQTVTVTAAEDDDADTDAAVPLAHVVASTDDEVYDALADQTVTVTITDNDTRGVSINPTTLTVLEGSSKSYTVELTSQPAGDVTVTVSGHSGSDLSLSGLNGNNVLTFTTVNWNVAQTVTVTAAEDDDAGTDPAVTLVHAVASTDDEVYDALADQTVTITITDNDTRGVSINPTELTVVEGSSKSYTVELTSEPAGDVTVTVSGHSGTDVGLSAAVFTDNVLTFTTVNWDTVQTVTVTAAEDDDADTDPAVTLAHAVASTDDSAYDALADQTVTITITDNDAVGVDISETALTVDEGDANGVSYTVKLTSEPAGDVTVTVSGHSGSYLSLSGLNGDNVLTFTTENWNVAQIVTVTADDDDDADDDDVALAHAVASTDDSAYDALADQTVTITITDNDAVGVSINPTTLTVLEGSSKSYTVELTSEPAGDVTVTVSGHSGTDVGLSAAVFTDNVLTFTTVNWDTVQTVTVTAAEDDDADTDAAVTLAHDVASTDDSAYDALADQTVTVTITDNDAVGVSIDPTELTVLEGSSKSYTVELTSEPAGDVTVTVSGHSGTDVGLSAAVFTDNVLTFTTVNWDTVQTVTVTAAEDDDADTDAAVTLAHDVASTDDSAYDALTDQTVTVTITDNDAVGVSINPTTLTVLEGSSKSYTVELTSEPAGDVTVTVSGHSGTDVGLSAAVFTDNVLTFTTVNWDTVQTVTVTAAEDDDADTDAAVTLAHDVASTDDSAYDALTDQTVTVTITDDDAVGVSIDPTELTVLEGSSKSYTVELTSEPAGDVTVTVSGHSGTDVGLSAAVFTDNVLTFTAENWDTVQTVTVTAAEDDDADTDAAVTLAHDVASTDDSAYDALADQTVTVTITDNDAVGVDISETALTVDEGDANGVSYTVKLTSEPAGDVTVTVSGHSGSDLSLSGLNGDNVLTFTTVNWDTAQTVTVTAAEDDDADTDAVVALVHAVASADDSDYDALTDQTVTITVTDDDAVGVSINPTELTVVEGSSKSYTVELTSQPAGDVTVTVSGHAGSGAALSGTSLSTDDVLTFTTVNWSTAQTVTVTGTDDSTAEADETVTLAHAISSTDDSAYDALEDVSVTVTVQDNDSVGVSINPTTLTVVEGSSKSYTVELTSQPGGDVTVTVSGHAGSGAALSGTSLSADDVLTFTTVNWSTAQTVTVTGTDDSTAEADETVTLAHAISSTDDSAYDALEDVSVTVTVQDNDSVGVSINPTTLTVVEGSSKSYTVELTSQPAGDVTVTVSGHSGTDVGLSAALFTSNVLTFTTANWSTAQTVTVTAAEDDDAVTDPAVTLAHAVASTDDSDYDALTDQTVTVTITDDDAVGVDISETALTVTEGSSKSYTVKLTSQPAGDVTVTVSGHSGTDVGLAGLDGNSKLTFTTVNWATAQTVTVTAAEDDDAGTDAAVALVHAVASTDDEVYDALADQTVTVTITDNDAVGVSINPTELTVVEGSSKSYTVELTSEPAGDVTVTVSGHSGSDLSLSGLNGDNVLTFTTVNWDTAQTVTVTAAEDDDADTDAVVALVHAVASADDSDYDALTDQTVTITVTDDDAVGVSINPTELTVVEGSSKSYTVELTSQPAGDVTVTVSGHAGSGAALSGTSLSADDVLTFTTVNWSTAQTVTVTGTDDSTAEADETVTLAHAISSTDDSAYDALEDVSVTVTVQDNDSVGVSINPTTLTVVEGSSKSYTVELTSQPAGDVTVTVSGHAGSGAALSGTSLSADDVLTFTTVNWSTAQTVTVTGTDDSTAEADETVTLAHAISSTDDSAYDALEDVSVTVTVQDNDSVGVSINPTTLTVVEGSSKSYTVELTSQPGGDVTVTVSGHSGTDVGLSAALFTSNVLTFTTANWSTAQTVTVTAAEDDDAVTDPAVTLAHAVASTDDSDYDALTDQTVTVTITDDDAVGVDISETALTVTEGSSKSYTVKLTSQPAGDVTVTVSGHSGTDVGLAGLDGNSKLTFTTVNWATAQTVTVTAAEDDDADTDPVVALAHAIASTDDSAYNTLEDVSVTVTVQDNDSVGVSINPTTLTVTEGSSKSYSVELTSQPGGDVTVTVSGHSGTDVGLSAAVFTDNVLTFTTSDWDTAQSVTVTAAEDDDAVTDPAVTLVHAVASTDDSVYDALEDVSVTITITDNDTAVTVSFEKDFHRTSEGASGGAFATVQLSTASPTRVTIPISVSSTTTAGTNDYELSTQPFQPEQNYAAVPVSGTFDVTFEAGDSVAYFAIRALPDTVFENDEKVVLEFGALPAGISTGNPSATTFHLIDTQTVSFGATSYSATEGGPGATVTVNLDYAPTGGAIVCLVVENQAGTSDDDYAGVPDELEFADTETSRSFVVTVADDTDSDGGSITARLGCLTGVFREGSPSSTTVNLLDDDPPGVFREGSPSSTTVNLLGDDPPGGNPGAEGLPAPRGFMATFLMFEGHYYNKTQSSVTLLWFPLDRAVQYRLEQRKTGDGGDWAVVAGDFEEYSGGGGGPVAVAAGLECDTEYDFRLSAAAVENADASGFGDYAETRARTGPCPEPELVTNLLVAMTPACATLHWTAPLDGHAVAYRVQRTDLGQPLVEATTLTVSTSDTTFKHCPPDEDKYQPDGQYIFSVAALTADAQVYGEKRTQIVNAGSKGPPNVARNLRFSRQSPQVRSLAWDPPPNVWLTTVTEAAHNDGYSNEFADPWCIFVVQRAELDSASGYSTLVDGSWQNLGETTDTTFTDRENIGDRIFVYRVLTRNSRGGFAAGYDPEIWMERPRSG